MEILLGALADAIFGILITDLAQQPRLVSLREKLHGNSPEKIALQRALTNTYLAFCREYPELSAAFFDEFFLRKPQVITELSKILTPNQSPNELMLEQLWAMQFHSKPNINLMPSLAYFLRTFQEAVKSEPLLKPFVDSRAFEQLYAIATRTEDQVIIQAEIRDLLSDIRRLLDEAQTVKGMRLNSNDRKLFGYTSSSSSRLVGMLYQALESLSPEELLKTEVAWTNYNAGKQLLNEVTILIDLFEIYIDEIASVLEEADIAQNFYGSADRVSKNRLQIANRKLITISNEMRSIYRKVKRRFILSPKSDETIERITSICAQISIVENFLVINLLNNPDILEFIPTQSLRFRQTSDEAPMPDNFDHPTYLDELGSRMLNAYHSALIVLNNYKLSLQEKIDDLKNAALGDTSGTDKPE